MAFGCVPNENYDGRYWLGLRMGVISMLIGLGDNVDHPGAGGHFMSDRQRYVAAKGYLHCLK